MSEPARKITLSPSRDTSFEKLVLRQVNQRRIKADISVEQPAEDNASRGLLQGQSVRPVMAEDGSETDTFEIPADSRHFQNLALLVEQNRMDKMTPRPCIVRDANSSILAEENLLAESMRRAAQNPLDQFLAFVALRDRDQGDEEIAAAFFVTPEVVKQHLKLASVSLVLLDCLVSKTLLAQPEAIATDVCKSIVVSLDSPYGYSHGLRWLGRDTATMTDDEGAAYAKLFPDCRAHEKEHEGLDEFLEEFDARLGELEIAMEKIKAHSLVFVAEEIARAAAFVTLDRYDKLVVYRGFVWPEAHPRNDADVHSGGQAVAGQGDELSAWSNVGGICHGRVITFTGQALGANVPEDEDGIYSSLCPSDWSCD